MAYGSSKPPGPRLEPSLCGILPHQTFLRDGSAVVLQRALLPSSLTAGSPHVELARRQVEDGSAVVLSADTFESIHRLLNHEICHAGNSYPFEDEMNTEQFENYFLGNDAFVLRIVSRNNSSPQPTSNDSAILELPDREFAGCFYVKPNYPGCSSHLCNGGFLVAPAYRRLGVGQILGERYRHVAQRLGYRASVFNLVFHDNPGSIALWRKLRFTEVGVLPGAGRRGAARSAGGTESDGSVTYADASIFYLDLTKQLEPFSFSWLPEDDSANGPK